MSTVVTTTIMLFIGYVGIMYLFTFIIGLLVNCLSWCSHEDPNITLHIKRDSMMAPIEQELDSNLTTNTPPRVRSSHHRYNLRSRTSPKHRPGFGGLMEI